MKDNLKYTFSNINDWIKVADTKANYFLTYNLGYIVVLSQFIDDKTDLLIKILYCVCSILSFVSLYFLISVFTPRLQNKLKKSNIYFLHLAEKYCNDQISGVEKLQKISENDYISDLSGQIVINSIIAKEKFSSFSVFIRVFGLQLFLGFLLIILSKLI